MENLVNTDNIWRGRRVLITGHTGFKGGWLSLWLSKLGAQVTGVSLPPLPASMFEISNIDQCAQSFYLDIRDSYSLTNLVDSIQPEIVFHLAAQPLVRRSYLDPIETYTTNIIGTVNLLEAIRLKSTNTRAIVVVTTDKCYENKEWVWGYRETDSLGGHDPYSCSKAAAELVASSYARSFFGLESMPALATARAGNVIGGGDFAADRLLPDLISACHKSENLFIRYPNAIRPWQHVLEPLSGYIKLAESLFIHGNKYSGPWNFGPTEASFKTVSWIVEYFIKAWNSDIIWTTDDSEQPHESGILKLDCSKSGHYLNWNSKLSIEDSISLVVKWHKAHINGDNMQDLSNFQVSNYLSK